MAVSPDFGTRSAFSFMAGREGEEAWPKALFRQASEFYRQPGEEAILKTKEICEKILTINPDHVNGLTVSVV